MNDDNVTVATDEEMKAYYLLHCDNNAAYIQHLDRLYKQVLDDQRELNQMFAIELHLTI